MVMSAFGILQTFKNIVNPRYGFLHNHNGSRSLAGLNMSGGLRPNAGRKRLLTDMQELGVGVECEALYKRAEDDVFQAQKEKIFARSDYVEMISKIMTIPQEKRCTWLQSEEFQVHCDDIEIELHAIAETDIDSFTGDGNDVLAPRIVSVPYRRPYGVRMAIITAVAQDWSKRIGKQISAGTVKRCWDEYRASLRKMKEDD